MYVLTSMRVRSECRVPVRVLRAVTALLFLNPYPVAAAITLVILTRFLAIGMKAHIGETGWYLHDVLFYGGCGALVSILFLMAFGQIVLTCIVSCRRQK
jgi:hypothetical protein